MKQFRNLPIQQKLLAMTLLICGAVLLIALIALFVFQVLNFRSNFQRDNSTLAEIIANQSTAAVAFKDEATATEVVGSLKAKSTVLSASLVLPDGSILAHFGPKEFAGELSGFPPAGQHHFRAGQLMLTQPVVLKNERVGTLYLRTDYNRTLSELLGFYGWVVAGILIVAITLAVFLSSRLVRTITQPVLQLAQTAKIIGEQQDYSVRAVVGSRGDELGLLASSFNEMLGRIESQDAALQLSQQKTEALIHSIDGIVWERTADRLGFSFISRQCQDILGYEPQSWLTSPNFWEEKLHPLDAAVAIKTGQAKVARGEPYSFEYRMLAADGRSVWIRESGMVLMDKGQTVAVRGIFQDITQHKLDAEQLDKLNRQLIDTSRSAGMADVATGVLHNVGNVLNSVSVSATVVGERLRRSKITNLQRATAMLTKQNGHLAEFLTNDPKGKLLPAYLGTVADQLVAEQAELVEKMSSVGQHIEHIKEIVAMQQNYAKVSGLFENLDPAELVEDALRLNLAAFERHQIELIRDFSRDVPKIYVDRHKFLQILINLLRNAKHAMDEVTGGQKRMTIAVALAGPDRVKIVVTDNGIGIPQENINKVFNHGFTTKKQGHGFGLHSGANAAKEMGGSLQVRSEGSGRGAEFTLELPVAPTNRHQD